uniref:Succinate dehydrogenase assembly factor 4, mitochondrial n=1 Tax=Albugo laibachii Nc14 TaxID=890382 RepID=F0WYP8_9STRA|nr:AlNc14C394G11311 [Albugo laibachii Nc14]|eukprot:CCA26607.1 AlNc14C394G11311 [Albugo laibachii Nc14]
MASVVMKHVIKLILKVSVVKNAAALNCRKKYSALQCQKRYWSDIPKSKIDSNAIKELDLDYESEDDEEEILTSGPSGPEYGGPTKGGKLPEPTRYGDWERNGRCTDF